MSGYTRRSFLALGGAAIGAAAVSGCGSNSGGLTGGGGGGEDAPLSQWYHQYGEKGTDQAAKKYAAAYKDATVKVQWTLGDYAAKLSTRLLSGKGVDIFENNAIDQASVEQERYADLTDIMEPIKDQFNEASLVPVTVNDKIWGIPMLSDPQQFFYRKSLFEKKGIKPPKTFDDLVSAAKELTEKKVKGLFLGNAGDAANRSLIWASGSDLFNSDRSKSAYATAEYAHVLDQVRKMKQDGSLLQGAPADWADPSAFINGLCAIAWSGCWGLPQAEEALGDDLGVFAMPAASSKGKETCLVGSWNQQVAAKASNVEAAKKFAKWLWVDQEDYQTDWALGYGFHIPPRLKVAEGAEELKKGNGAAIAAMAKEHGVSASNPYWTGKMNTPLADASTKILQKKNVDPLQELEKAAKLTDRAIQQ